MKLTMIALLSAIGALFAAVAAYFMLRSKPGRSRDYNQTIGRSLNLASKGKTKVISIFHATKQRAHRSPRKPDPTPQAA